MDIFSEHVDPARDNLRERVIEVSDGPSFILYMQDPYGFWKIRRERGQVPEHMQGEYTTVQMAREAVQTYVTNRKKAAA